MSTKDSEAGDIRVLVDKGTIGYALGLPLDRVVYAPGKRPFTVADKSQPLTHLFA